MQNRPSADIPDVLNASLLEAFCDRLRSGGYNELTILRDRRRLSRVARCLGNRGLSDLRCSDIEDLLAKMMKGRTRSWIGNFRQSLHRWFGVPGLSRHTGVQHRGQWEHWTDDYARFLADHRGLLSGTIQDNITEVKAFLAATFGTGRAQWAEVSVDRIWRYCERCAKGVKPGYANKRLFTLRRFLQFVHMRGACSSRLFHSVPHVASFKTASTPPPALSDAQRRRLLAAFPRRLPTGHRDHTMALCMMDLGLRSAEVALLRVQDVDLKHKRICVPAIKSGRGRELPLPSRVAAGISEYLARSRPKSSSDRLFLRASSLVGRPTSALAIQAAMARAYRRAGLPKTWHGSHRLRHTFATRLFASGATLKEIADLLGHRRLDSANIYTGVDLASLRGISRPWPI